MKKPPKGYKPAPVQVFVRKRDDRDSWVVECFDSAGAWLWTHFGTCNMTKAQAKKLARDWFKPSKAKEARS